MATITFLWHLHQPAYRTADGIAHAPWVAVHAGGAYTTLARALLETGARGHVINLVPTLVEQMEAYRDGRVHDRVIDALCCPAPELADEDVFTLLEWAFYVSPRQLDRYPRLAELAARRAAIQDPARSKAMFGRGDLRDLQVLFILAQAGEQAWRDEELAPLARKAANFDASDHKAAAAWLYAQPARILDLWRRLADQDGIEISTSPFAHPIIPLLIDTSVVKESWAPQAPPAVPVFSHPEDAHRQVELALELMRTRGFAPRGCWPPEGSVSEAALELYAAAGIRWLVTDEGILERSLGRGLREAGRFPVELSRPWRLGGGGPFLFFRDRQLSDRIGFVYGRWEDEERAARDLVGHLEAAAALMDEDGAIVLALDGENPWLHYPHGGGSFLRSLSAGIESSARLRPDTLSSLTERLEPEKLPRLHPGSWIGSTFATWIGHPEKSSGWQILADVRKLVGGTRPCPPPMILAEGSDWFWWLGDDNPTPLASLYDRIFRRHLADACVQAGVTPPKSLERPIKVAIHPVEVPVSADWPPPVFDGRITSYFEWSLAQWVELSKNDILRRLGLWSDGARLFLVIEGEREMHDVLTTRRLTIRLTDPLGEIFEMTLDDQGARSGLPNAVGRVVEAALDWDGAPGWRLGLEIGTRYFPEDSVFALNPFEVDEEM
ncbi:MAG: hypothetical protein GXP48_11475 [Acidobacteria bacterium]|nr:hypothetical protein [Acidobacteriota bacterium]